ncbi:HAD family hydrolase [Sphingomonas sp. ZT3P38]|uniref:HAD family hydrolase n=1 Tax=Parasphingomonas zepuensis TaxID=3096161 RepID=UPI002FC7B1D0
MAQLRYPVATMPPARPSSPRTLLILDLDETLIYATEQPLDRPADFGVYGYHVYRRPHLDAFLAECAQHFELAVWSSASDDYVKAVVENIFPDPAVLHFIWGRSRATLRRVSPDDDGYMLDPWDHLHYLKPLTKVKKAGWPLQRVLIVDDTPEKCLRNYGNAIYPRSYEGAEDDIELGLLAPYLASLKDEPNVRSIEKRRWREAALSRHSAA